MNDKFFRFLERYHNFLRVFLNIFSLGILLGTVILFTIARGFPNGFVEGLVLGSIFGLFCWIGLRIKFRDTVEARKKLEAYYRGEGDLSIRGKQATFFILRLIVCCVLVIFLFIYNAVSPSGINALITLIILFLIGAVVASEMLFRQGRLKRRTATLSLISLAAIVILLVVKMLFFR